MKAFFLGCLLLIMVLFGALGRATEPAVCARIGSGLPTDALTLANADGSLSVSLPEGWKMWIHERGIWRSGTKAAKITCTCDSGNGGCSPGTFGGEVACVMTSCKTCSRSGVSAFIPFRAEHEGIAFASRKDVDTLPSANKALMSIPDVVAAVEAFKRSLGIAPGARAERLVMIRVFGHLAALEMPDSARIPSTGSQVGDGAMQLLAANLVTLQAAKISCKCETSGRCPHESSWGVHWCDASNCKSCTMSGY